MVPVWFNVVPTMPERDLCSQLQNPPRLTVDPLLDASSALTKGGQVMFRPQPLLQLPKLPSHVVPECAACLEKQSGQTAPLLKFYAAGGATCRRPVCP